MKGTRKLVSILFTDIKGYTAIMEKDEEKALELIAIYKHLIEEYCTQYNGRVIQYMGDGALIVFSNSVDAVQFAIRLQSEILATESISNRIGIHTGEVIMNEGNIHGDSVNVASRVESIAVPGSVIISKSTYDQIKNKQIFKTKSLGKIHFKNQSKPMEVFAITNDPLIVPKRGELQGKTKTGRGISAGAIAWLVLILAAAFFLIYQGLVKNPVSEISGNPWEGSWNHQMYIDGNEYREGELTFRYDDKELLGSAKIWYDQNRDVDINIVLDDIEFNDDKRSIEGSWESDLEGKEFSDGYFELKMNSSSTEFTGTYGPEKQGGNRYRWSGKRK